MNFGPKSVNVEISVGWFKMNYSYRSEGGMTGREITYFNSSTSKQVKIFKPRAVKSGLRSVQDFGSNFKFY